MPASQRPLHSSAQSFLTHLNLPHHPNDDTQIEELSTVGEGVFELPLFHSSRSTTSSQRGIHDGPNLTPPKIGPISMLELHDNSYAELIKTAWTMSAPTLAMAELWLRLFALAVGPVCVACLICWEIRRFAHSKNSAGSTSNTIMLVSVLGVASSAILFTDSLYVYEYGRSFGCALFAASSFLALRVVGDVKSSSKETITNSNNKNSVSKNKAIGFSGLIWGLIITTMIVFARSDGGHAMRSSLEKVTPISILSGFVSASTATTAEDYNPLTHLGDPGIDLPTIEPGFYHSSNPLIQSIAKHWPESSRTYDVNNGATPYLVNGDQRTGIPFLVNKIEEQEYIRVYVRNPFDQESIALDIAFPYSNNGKDHANNANLQHSKTFIHNLEKPVYLILHGLNGGSHEEYVKDFVLRRRSEGSTVIVMIARGMMDTTMRGWNVFHGARTGDVDIAARAVKRGLEEAAKEKGVDVPVLAGIGYSMGAIILSNYVARSGSHCALDSAIAISGGLDMRQQLNFRRSMRLWQPMLTFGLREDILLGKYARHYKHRLTKEQFMNMLRVTSISHLDVEAIVNYNSFDDLVHYYSEMSAMGDRHPEFQLFDDYDGTCNTSQDRSWGRIANVSVPFLVLQALDDPLVGWRTVGTNNATDLVNSGSGNTVLLLTKAGGHVGWPLGSKPKENGWKWMNDVASSFVEAFSLARKDVERS